MTQINGNGYVHIYRERWKRVICDLHRMHVTRSRHFDHRIQRDVFDHMKHEDSVIIIEDIFERRDDIGMR